MSDFFRSVEAFAHEVKVLASSDIVPEDVRGVFDDPDPDPIRRRSAVSHVIRRILRDEEEGDPRRFLMAALVGLVSDIWSPATQEWRERVEAVMRRRNASLHDREWQEFMAILSQHVEVIFKAPPVPSCRN